MVPLIGQPFLYLLAIAAGTAVSAALVIFLKGMRRTARPETAAAATDGHSAAGGADGEAKVSVTV